MKIREILMYEAGPDPEDPRGIRPTTAIGKLPMPSNFTAPVLSAEAGTRPPTPVSPVSSTNPGGPITGADMRGIAIKDGLPTAMGMTMGTTQPAGVAGDSSVPDLPVRRNA